MSNFTYSNLHVYITCSHTCDIHTCDIQTYTHTHITYSHKHIHTYTHAHTTYSTVVVARSVALLATCRAVILMPRAWMGCAYYRVTMALLRHPRPQLRRLMFRLLFPVLFLEFLQPSLPLSGLSLLPKEMSCACMMSVRLEDRGCGRLEHTANKSIPIYLNVPRMMRREVYLALIRPLMERRFATRLSTVRISDPQKRYVTSCTLEYSSF